MPIFRAVLARGSAQFVEFAQAILRRHGGFEGDAAFAVAVEIVLHRKDCQHGIADEFQDLATARQNRPRHGVEIVVERCDDEIARQFVRHLGEARRSQYQMAAAIVRASPRWI
jgi:hypothetical protein